MTIDPVTAALMQPGAPYETAVESVGGVDMRVYKHALSTLTDVFDVSRSFGDADFIVSGNTRLTYGQFFERADSLAGWLQSEANITAGKSVVLCAKNSPEWMIAFVAVLYTGAVPVLLNSRASGPAMTIAAKDADSVFLIADAKRLSLMRGADCALPALVFGADFDAACKSRLNAVRPQRCTDDAAALFFSSGTTGRAKAAVMTHRNLVTGLMNTQMAMTAVFQRMAAAYNISVEALRANLPQSCSLLVFPLFHTSGCSAIFLTTMAAGGKLVLMDRWNGAQALRLVQTEKVSSIGGVPAMHWDLIEAAQSGDYDLSALKSISCGGQALPLGVLEKLLETFPGIIIGAGYGMTETSGAISQANGDSFLAKPEASGQVLSMLDVQIVDEMSRVLPTGEVGEIRVKGPTVMKGYYGRPDDTAAAFDNGWFKTGDVGFLDEDGYIHIVDRITDMVISGGENIYCAEIEQVFSKCPGVKTVCVFGVPDDRLGERLITAFDVGDSGLTRADLEAYATRHLGDYKRPKDYVIQQEPFALNAMGKVTKQDVREVYLAAQKDTQ